MGLQVISPAGGGGDISQEDLDAAITDALAGHTADTTAVHGLADTANVVETGDAAGGVLSGTFPNPGFAVDMATQAEMNALLDGAAWASWTPTWTNLSVGNGSVEAKYKRIGKTVFARLALVFGSTTAVTGTGVLVTLPVTAVIGVDGGGLVWPPGPAMFLDSGTNTFHGQIVLDDTKTKVRIQSVNMGTTSGSSSQLASASPFTWATNDGIFANFMYEGV